MEENGDNNEKEENEGIKPISIKIALLGNSGVGKTCIIQRYNLGEFSENSISTKGASYSNKIIEKNGKIYQLDIWDTAGQEQYRSIGRHFYKNAYIIILVYDITVRKSFEDLKIWCDDLSKNGEKYTILAIVGNKSDLYEKEEITEEEGINFAKGKNALFMLVSAKNGNNIENLFNDVLGLYLDPDFQIKVDEMSQRDNGSIKIRKKTKYEEEKFKKSKKGKCC